MPINDHLRIHLAFILRMVSNHPSLLLSYDTILALSRDILHGFNCEWADCSSTLNSFSAFQKHIYLHCKVSGKRNVYKCHWESCFYIIHSSLNDLIDHVDLCHLSRVPLLCPFKACPMNFPRHQNLSDHFMTIHTMFQEGQPIDPSSPYLHPTSNICHLRLAHTKAGPSTILQELPSMPIPVGELGEVLSVRSTVPPGAFPTHSQLSQVSQSSPSKRKRGRLEELGRKHGKPPTTKVAHSVSSGDSDGDSEEDSGCKALLKGLVPDEWKSRGMLDILFRPVIVTQTAAKQISTPPMMHETALPSCPSTMLFEYVNSEHEKLSKAQKQK